MSAPRLIVRRRKVANVLAGEPWIYPNAVIEAPETATTAPVVTDDGEILGVADCNPASALRARLLWRGEDLEAWPGEGPWLHERLAMAVDRRMRLGYQLAGGGVRLVNAEGDGLPGLVIDLLGRHLVIDLHSLGMRDRLPLIEAFLAEQLADCPRSVRLGRDTAQREGCAALEPASAEAAFGENGVLYKIPLGAAQKTGFYLDQRDNRRLVAAWADGRRVLDLFSYHGGFSMACLANGAAEVLAVDSSQPALDVAIANAEANEFALQTLCADVFDTLPKLREQGAYDLIICDPPKLAPRRTDAPKALKAYRYLIAQCLELLSENGILLVASCSQAIGAEDLRLLLAQQGRKAQMELDVLAITGQPSDHPWPVAFTTGSYLSAVIVERRG